MGKRNYDPRDEYELKLYHQRNLHTLSCKCDHERLHGRTLGSLDVDHLLEAARRITNIDSWYRKAVSKHRSRLSREAMIARCKLETEKLRRQK